MFLLILTGLRIPLCFRFRFRGAFKKNLMNTCDFIWKLFLFSRCEELTSRSPSCPYVYQMCSCCAGLGRVGGGGGGSLRTMSLSDPEQWLPQVSCKAICCSDKTQVLCCRSDLCSQEPSPVLCPEGHQLLLPREGSFASREPYRLQQSQILRKL